MPGLLSEHVALLGDEVALRDTRRSLTWAALDVRVERWLAALYAHGLRSGDRVAIVSGNRCEVFEVLLACLQGGLTVVPVNWHFTAREIAHVLADSASRAVVVDPAHAPVTAAAVAGLERPPALGLVMGNEPVAEFAALEPLLDAAADPPGERCSGALLLYTSGTSGRPKGVVNAMFSSGAPLERVARLAAGLSVVTGIPGRGCGLLIGPWYHAAQLSFALFPLLRGCTMLLRERFDAAETLRTIDAEQIRFCHLVPTQMIRLLRLDGGTRDAFGGGSLERVWHGGGPCPPQVKRRMIGWWGEVLVEYYGATEGGIATLITSRQWLDRPGSVGRPVPGTEIVIADEQGMPLPAGRQGRVFVRRAGGAGFAYLNAADATRAAHLAPDTFTYGDEGYLDEDGFLFLAGRADDTIISGGVNTHPTEVEAVVLAHPWVRDAAVFGVPDAEFGQRVHAVVELEPEVAPQAATAALDAFCREHLASFKVPRDYRIVPSMPRQATGKLPRRALRELYERQTMTGAGRG